jgi:hypothetical protein
MKLFNLTMLSLAVLLFAAVFYSCSKQGQTEPAGLATEIYQSEADILIENKIIAFKGKMELLRKNPSYKSGETISVDSAVWYLKAALNYTYARAGVDFNHLSNDSAAISVSLTNGEIAENELPDIYLQILDSVRAIYNAAEGNDKNLYMVNVAPSDASVNSTDLTIYAATGTTAPTYIYGQFDETDYWYWGGGLGKCNAYQGQHIGEDATTVLEYRINHPLVSYPPGTYFIPDDDPTQWFYPWDYEDEYSPNGYYRLFNIEGLFPPQDDPCLSPDEMTYYLYDGVEYIMQDNKPTGKYLTLGEVRWYIATPPTGFLWYHYVRFTYGERHISGNPIEEL